MPWIDPEQIEHRSYEAVPMRGGLDLSTGKFEVRPGTLQDCLNYEASDEGYTRSQGLLFYDGAYDHAVQDLWYIGTTSTESTLVGEFKIGDVVEWSPVAPSGPVEGTGKVVYFNVTAGSPDKIALGIVEVEGRAPQEFDSITVVDSSPAVSLDLAGVMVYEPTTIVDGAVSVITGLPINATIASYLSFINGTVNYGFANRTAVPGSIYHKGKIPGSGAITGGFQFQDYVYGVRDYFSILFVGGVEDIQVGDALVLDDGGGLIVRGVVGHIRLTDFHSSLEFSQGIINFIPQTEASDAWVNTTAYTLHDLVSNDGVEYICILGHTSDPADEPGVGINSDTYWTIHDLANLDLMDSTQEIWFAGTTTEIAQRINIGAAASGEPKGVLWKAETEGWSAVDTGYTLVYDEGQNAPSVRDAPLFVESMLEVVKASAAVPWTAVAQAPGGDEAWTDPTNATGSDDARATCSLAAGEVTAPLYGTIPASIIPSEGIRILGIEVNIEGRYGTAAGAQDYFVALHHTGATALDPWGVSANRSHGAPLGAADATVTFGGETDLWGLEEITPEDILSGDIVVRVQYNNPGGVTSVVEIDNLTITVHYVPVAEHVYFWNGASDVSEADIVAFQIANDEAFGGSPAAAGYFTLYNVTNPDAIVPNLEIRTAASGGGDLIADSNSYLTYNYLPSQAEMEAAESFYQSIVANFYSDEGAESVYVATGAGPLFAYNGTHASFIRTPLLPIADKPRYVEFFVNMLALGYSSGHVLLSAVGAPHDFSGLTGGTSWGFRDPITGLVAVPGDTLAVFARSSIGTLTGQDSANMQQKHTQQSSGAQNYTVQNLGLPYFVDFHGITDMATSDKYGDFDVGRLSETVSPFLRSRLQRMRTTETISGYPVSAIHVRNKRQYRLYFKDGVILTATFFPNSAPEFTWQNYDPVTAGTYTPTFLDSSVLSTGRERIVMGTSDGSMWIVDGANLIINRGSTSTPNSYITLNPLNMRRPQSVSKVYKATIQGQFYGYQSIQVSGDTNYRFDYTGAAHDTVSIGSTTAPVSLRSDNELDDTHIHALTDGFSIKLKTTVDGSKPHTFQSLLIRATGKGTDRNRADKAY